MRPIDASKLLFEIQVCSWDSERDKDMAEDLVLGMPTLTPPNEWVSVKDAMPPEHEPVMCIVSGEPETGHHSGRSVPVWLVEQGRRMDNRRIP